MDDTIRKWRTTGSRTIVDDRWLRLRADACVTPTGEVLDPFYVIDCRDWVAVVAVTTGGDLVLVEQYRHPVSRVTLELPAGEIDPGEDAVTAARRELWEESGYVGGEAKIIRHVSANPARNSNTLWFVLIRGVTAEAPAPPQSGGEETRPLLHPWSRMPELLLSPDFDNPQHLAALAAVLASGAGGPP